MQNGATKEAGNGLVGGMADLEQYVFVLFYHTRACHSVKDSCDAVSILGLALLYFLLASACFVLTLFYLLHNCLSLFHLRQLEEL